MKSYLVIYLKDPEKFLHKAPQNIALRILNHIDQVALNPLSKNTNLTKLKAPLDGYRLRVGDYRIIYLLDHTTTRLIVTKIDHRSNVYL